MRPVLDSTTFDTATITQCPTFEATALAAEPAVCPTSLPVHK